VCVSGGSDPTTTTNLFGTNNDVMTGSQDTDFHLTTTEITQFQQVQAGIRSLQAQVTIQLMPVMMMTPFTLDRSMTL